MGNSSFIGNIECKFILGLIPEISLLEETVYLNSYSYIFSVVDSSFQVLWIISFEQTTSRPFFKEPNCPNIIARVFLFYWNVYLVIADRIFWGSPKMYVYIY